jgi:meso-butanediol dehydrogenase / (S,S)-butanediol dehydrogenase / diacetyl reductase
MPTKFDEARVAVVTGGGRGAGRSIAQRLAEDGFDIAVGDVDEKSARLAANEIAESTGRRATGLTLNVANCESVDAFAAAVVAALGTIDVLVNNAGVISIAPISAITEAEWNRVIDINLKGVFLCSKTMMPELTKRGWGRVVNISSDVGKRGEANLAHYCASKFGVVGITQAIAMEVAKTGVTVNAICPAIMNTDMMKQIAKEAAALSGADATQTYAHLADVVPLGRATEPSDIANVVSFLCSEDAAFLTGQSLNVTGGRWMT